MSSLVLRLIVTSAGLAAAAGLGFGAIPVVRWAQQLAADYGAGFVVIIGLMTMLVLISIVRMPLSHAGRPHRRPR